MIQAGLLKILMIATCPQICIITRETGMWWRVVACGKSPAVEALGLFYLSRLLTWGGGGGQPLVWSLRRAQESVGKSLHTELAHTPHPGSVQFSQH